MSKEFPGKISNEKKAEKCKTALNGAPCPLFFEGKKYSTCSVQVAIDYGRNSPEDRQRTIDMNSSQIPADCPASYK